MATLADLLIKVGIDPAGVEKGAGGIESRMDKTWGKLKAGAMVGGAAVGVALVAGIQQGLQTEAITDRLAASLGATGPEAEALGKTAGDLYKRGLGDSMETVAEAVGAVKSSFGDLGAAELDKTSERALNLAKTFQIDVSRAAQVASQTVTSGLAKDSTQAFDLLTASMQRVPAAVREDLVDAIDEYGPFMNNVGITGEKAFGLLVNSAQKGMYGLDKTGDALKEFTIRATDMSAASKVGYDALGMSQEEMSAKLLKGGETGAKAFDQIIGGLMGIKDPVKQSQAALALFGTPLEDLNVNDIPKFLAGLKNTEGGLGKVAGATDKMGETLNDNAATKLEAFKRQAQAALVEQMAKALPAIEAVGKWMQENATFVKIMATVFGVLAVALGIAAVAQWAMNSALLASPITWIILAIAGLIAIIVLVATKTKFFQTIWAAVWGFMKGVGAWFAGPFANFFVQLWNKITAKFRSGVALIRAMITSAKNILTGWWNTAKAVFSRIQSDFGRVVNFFRSAPGKIRGALSGMFDGLWSGFKSVVNRIIGGWNRLSFGIPGFSFAGMDVPGFNVGTPDIPYLAKGGITTGPTLAMIGEGNEQEAVVPLSRLPELAGRSDSDRPIVIEVAPGGETEFRRWIRKTIRVKGPVQAEAF